MKRLILFTALAAVSLSTMAQDDLYFNPKDEPKVVEKHNHYRPGEDPWHGGCPRDIDEYNRRGPLHSRVEKIGTDSLGSDIIQFQVGDGVYPADSIDAAMQVCPEEDDYACSRRISRWDDWYGPYDLWYASRWGWGWPYHGYWGYGYPYYSSLYWGWGGYYGWYDPWYWDYRPYWGWGWGRPGWGGIARAGVTGTRNHGIPAPRSAMNGTTGFRRYGTTTGTTRNSGWGNRSTGTTQTRTFGGQRSTYNNNTYTPSRSYSPSRSSSSFGGSRGGSSFGGSRGGGFGGGSRGGGSFGGRR